MWLYIQSTGELYNDGILKGIGYSGNNQGLNNPLAESIKSVGPVPSGDWLIQSWEDYHPHLGPLVARLQPIHLTVTYGRFGFFIHGDNPQLNYTASDGCIILSLELRQLIRNSGDNHLQVRATL